LESVPPAEEVLVSPQLAFLISVLFSFLAWSLVIARYVWPTLRVQRGPERFRPILVLHCFRFVGLAFLVPGVVSAELPIAFAQPAAYGDLIASLLALASLAMLSTPLGPAVLWVFNLWGTADLLYAYYQGVVGAPLRAGQLGATYFIPTALVPLLLITHGLVFRMLLAGRPGTAPSTDQQDSRSP
jgi:hypothetical protein